MTRDDRMVNDYYRREAAQRRQQLPEQISRERAIEERRRYPFLERARHDSMLHEQQERCIQVNRRTARRPFQEGYDAAMQHVRRDMGLMSMAYQQGHHDGRRDARRQLDDRPFDGPGHGFHYGTRGYSRDRRGYGHPPPGRTAAQPPWPPRQNYQRHRFQGHERDGGSRAWMPARPRSPPNHARRIHYRRSEWRHEVRGRRQEWRG